MSEPTERDLVGGPAVGQSTEGIAEVARRAAARRRSSDKPGEEPGQEADAGASEEASPEVLQAIAEETTT